MNNFHYKEPNKNNCDELKNLIENLKQYEPEIWKLIERTIAEEEFNKHRYGKSTYSEDGDPERVEMYEKMTERIRKLKEVREVLRDLLFYNFEK